MNQPIRPTHATASGTRPEAPRSAGPVVALLTILLLPLMPAVASADDGAKLVAAEKLLMELNLKQSLEDSMTAMIDMQIQSSPQMAPFRPIFVDFFKRHMSWESLKDEAAEIYAGEFTESELNEITTFYATPTGRKARAAMRKLTQRVAQVGIERATADKGELEALVSARAAELQAEAGATP